MLTFKGEKGKEKVLVNDDLVNENSGEDGDSDEEPEIPIQVKKEQAEYTPKNAAKPIFSVSFLSCVV